MESMAADRKSPASCDLLPFIRLDHKCWFQLFIHSPVRHSGGRICDTAVVLPVGAVRIFVVPGPPHFFTGVSFIQTWKALGKSVIGRAILPVSCRSGTRCTCSSIIS